MAGEPQQESREGTLLATRMTALPHQFSTGKPCADLQGHPAHCVDVQCSVCVN